LEGDHGRKDLELLPRNIPNFSLLSELEDGQLLISGLESIAPWFNNCFVIFKISLFWFGFPCSDGFWPRIRGTTDFCSSPKMKKKHLPKYKKGQQHERVVLKFFIKRMAT
jgi:hypothetical protein